MPASFMAKSETKGDSPDPTVERPFPPEAPSLPDGSNERVLKDVVGGLLISGDRRQRIPEPEVLLAIQILEFGQIGAHVSKST